MESRVLLHGGMLRLRFRIWSRDSQYAKQEIGIGIKFFHDPEAEFRTSLEWRKEDIFHLLKIVTPFSKERAVDFHRVLFFKLRINHHKTPKVTILPDNNLVDKLQAAAVAVAVVDKDLIFMNLYYLICKQRR